MIRLTFLFIVCFVAGTFVVGARGQTSFTERVSAMWAQGDKDGVLQIAQERLVENSNDIAGLLLELDYGLEFIQADRVTNAIERLQTAMPAFSGANFSSLTNLLWMDGEVLRQVVTNAYSPEEYAADLAKTNILGKRLIYLVPLEALEADGYFEEEP